MVDMRKVEFWIIGEEAMSKIKDGFIIGILMLILIYLKMPIIYVVQATHNII